jgi:hypothetical protein
MIVPVVSGYWASIDDANIVKVDGVHRDLISYVLAVSPLA